MVDSWERARRILKAAVRTPAPSRAEELSLTDGSRPVLKILPAAATPGLRHERRLLVSEAGFSDAFLSEGVLTGRAGLALGSRFLPAVRRHAVSYAPRHPAGPAARRRR